MDPWKHESQFGDFIAESSTFPTAPPSPGPNHQPSQPSDEDIQAFQRTLEQIQKVEAHLKRNKQETAKIQRLIQRLIGFLKGARKISALSINDQYERLQPLRTWLFWEPVRYLQNQSPPPHNQTQPPPPDSLVIIAHLYTVALLMERLFPEIGAAYFGSLSISPVEEIARRLWSMSAGGGSNALTLMEFPIHTVNEFRSRMGWGHPERTPSFPTFNPPNFPVAKQHFAHHGNLAFKYSAGELPMLNSAAIPRHSQASVSPLLLSSPFPNQQYLSIPSPTFGGAYSPASTLDGSVALSDTEECGAFASAAHSSGQPSMLGEPNPSYGLGFVTPHQSVWI